jgi:hypothetical protein
MSADHRILPLDSWVRDWDLGKIVLSCRGCGRSQNFANAHDPFVHGARCKVARCVGQYPMLELADILRHLPPVPA